VNSAMARYEADGSVMVVCADADPGFGHWVDLAGHRSGTGLWRWFNVADPVAPRMRVITL